MAAKTAGESLTIGDIAIRGEALLVTRDAAERVTRGMALGCTGMSVRGRKIAIGESNFEFTLPDGPDAEPKLDAIRRPMKGQSGDGYVAMCADYLRSTLVLLIAPASHFTGLEYRQISSKWLGLQSISCSCPLSAEAKAV